MNLDAQLAERLDSLQAAGQLRQIRAMQLNGTHLSFEGKSYFNLSSNDYLGLSSSAYAQYPLAQGLDASHYLHGNPSSRLMTGNGEEYEELEAELRLLFPQKKALVLSCGYMANCGLPAAIAEKGDVILADKLIHASLIDGARMGHAELKRFRHNDVEHLEKLLQGLESTTNVWVIIESLYSMDGDLAPLAEILELKRRYGFYLMVDEAHAFGVLGPMGKGRCAELQCEDEVELIMCTFGKAIAGAGACILCSELMRLWLINRMRSLIFTTALPPITLKWNSFVLKQMRTEELSQKQPELYPSFAFLRQHLQELTQLFSRESGFAASSQIIPIAAGSNERALHMAQQALEAGYCLTAIRPPTVPVGGARLRLSLTAAFSKEQITQFAHLCKRLG